MNLPKVLLTLPPFSPSKAKSKLKTNQSQQKSSPTALCRVETCLKIGRFFQL